MQYMNMQTMGSLAFVAMLVMSMFAISVIAGDSQNMDVEFDIGNVAPVITGMAVAQASYDPTEASNTTVTVYFNLSDTNGVGDLDDAKAYIYVDDAATFATAVGKYTRLCSPSANHSSTVREYQCDTDLEFFDPAGTYSTNITGGDQVVTVWNNTGTNAPTFTYTTLLAFNVSNTTIDFNSPSVGVANNSAISNPTTLQNRGNADLYVNITGADLTGASYTFGIGNFSVDLDADPTGEQVLTTSTEQINVSGTPAEMLKGASSTEDLYFFVDVPVATQPDSYTGTWTLGIYEQ